MSQDAALDLNQYLRMLVRRRGVVVLATVVVLCSSVVALQFVPEEYEAKATLRVEERRRLSGELEKVIGGGGGGGGGYRVDEARLDEMAARITSRPFLERVARLLKMNEDPRVIELARKDLKRYPDATVDELAIRRVVKKLKGDIRFSNSGMGNYDIIVSDSDPEHAYLLTKWISELFVDYSLQSSLEELRTAHDFGAEQERIYEQRLRDSELALERYKQATIQTNLEQGFVRASNASRAEALYAQVLDEVDLARLRLLPLSRAVADAGLESASQRVLDDARVQRQMQSFERDVRTSATEISQASESANPAEWPPGEDYLVARRGLYRLIEQRAADLLPTQSAEVRDLISRFAFASLDYRAHSGVAAYLGQAISDFKLKAQATPRDEMELERLESEVETNRSLLGSFRAQLIASDINQAMEITNLGMKVEILDPPQIPLRPARPDKTKILLAAFVLGPMLGVGIAFVAEIMDPTLRSLSDFRREFGGPVLGTAPLLVGRPVQGGGGLRRHWVATTVACILVLTILFFLTRDTLIADLTMVNSSPQVVDPGGEVSP